MVKKLVQTAVRLLMGTLVVTLTGTHLESLLAHFIPRSNMVTYQLVIADMLGGALGWIWDDLLKILLLFWWLRRDHHFFGARDRWSGHNCG